eukprot:g3966.t1
MVGFTLAAFQKEYNALETHIEKRHEQVEIQALDTINFAKDLAKAQKKWSQRENSKDDDDSSLEVLKEQLTRLNEVVLKCARCDLELSAVLQSWKYAGEEFGKLEAKRVEANEDASVPERFNFTRVQKQRYDVELDKINDSRLKKHDFCRKMRKVMGITSTSQKNSESDIEVVEEQTHRPQVCPVTRLPWDEPLKCKTCGHSYNKSGIFGLLKKKAFIKCPVAGCNNKKLQKSDLIRDLEKELESRNRRKAAGRSKAGGKVHE